MKYMNHLRKLALLSSLALSFVAYGDGTLPLPVVLDGDFTQLAEVAGAPMRLNVQSVRASSPIDIPGYGNPCNEANAYTFNAAIGSTLKIGTQILNVNGICFYPNASRPSDIKLTIVASKDSFSTFSILNVTLVTKGIDKVTSMAGKMDLESPEASVSGTFTLQAN